MGLEERLIYVRWEKKIYNFFMNIFIVKNKKLLIIEITHKLKIAHCMGNYIYKKKGLVHFC